MKATGVDEVDFAKGNGLVPVVTQEYETGKVLMVAYANREAVELTLKTRSATYWTRSRQKIWVKGEESGHVQKVRDVLVDCDGDTLVYVVEQTGAACHTGSQTCFYRTLDASAESHGWGSVDEGKETKK